MIKTNKINLKPWKITNTKTIHKTPWLELVEDTCEANGKEFIYTYTRKTEEGPLIIPEDKDGEIWLVRQYRHPIKKILWQFPMEGKNKDESWKGSAVRGLKEELGLEAGSWIDLGMYYPDPGGLEQKCIVYIARDLKEVIGEGKINTSHADEEVEDLEIAKFSREEIDEMIDSGDICGNWTLGALYLYDRYKRSL